MAVDRSGLPGIDSEGFVTLERLRALAHRGPAEFSRVFAVPALVVEGPSAEPGGVERALSDRERSFARTQQLDDVADGPGDPSDIVRYLGRVAFLAKRPGNPFPDMVSVGRALNSDVSFVVSSVSKVHGYFRQEAEGWTYTDQRSTNGTHVNGRRLEPGERVVLRDGDALRLGSDIGCTFLLPPSLARRLTS